MMPKNKNKISKKQSCNVYNNSNEDFQIKQAQNEYNNLAKNAMALDEYKFFPARICEIAETLNKFCLYVKGTSGRIFKLYMELIDRNMELLQLEKEKFFKETKEK